MIKTEFCFVFKNNEKGIKQKVWKLRQITKDTQYKKNETKKILLETLKFDLHWKKNCNKN